MLLTYALVSLALVFINILLLIDKFLFNLEHYNFSSTLRRFLKHTQSYCILLGQHWEHCPLVWKNFIEIAERQMQSLIWFLLRVRSSCGLANSHAHVWTEKEAGYGCAGTPVKPQCAFWVTASYMFYETDTVSALLLRLECYSWLTITAALPTCSRWNSFLQTYLNLLAIIAWLSGHTKPRKFYIKPNTAYRTVQDKYIYYYTPCSHQK